LDNGSNGLYEGCDEIFSPDIYVHFLPILGMLQSFSLHTPSMEAMQTINSIMVEDTSMKLLPTHCINSAGELEGFMLSVPAKAKGGILPINRTMFHGTSLFEVVSKAGSFNADVMRLQQTLDIRDTMKELMQQIAENSAGKEAAFRCVPDNVDLLSSVRVDGESHVAKTTGKRSVDFADWQPELPHSIGLYQAFCRGYQKDLRVHKLFIGVNGGLNRCSDEFYNLLLDVGNEFTCQEVAFSEEAWWLRKACQRARAKIALMTAKHYGLEISTCTDLFSFNQDQIGVPVVDTVEFDLKEAPDDVVEFYSACTDTTATQNGIITKMHESEGMWIFRGNAKSSAKATSFGALFGSKSVCGVFPTRSPYYKRNQGSPSFVNGLDTELIVRHTSAPRLKADGHVFQCFDEQFFGNLTTMQWDRNSGIIELVPIVVGLS
jgi:hypothetical protein